MKKLTKILFVIIVALISACSYSKDDITYLEASIPSLEIMLRFSEQETQNLKSKVLKKIRLTPFSYSPKPIVYKQKERASKLRATLHEHSILDSHIEEIQEYITNYLKENDKHKSIASLSFIDKEYQEKIDSLAQRYIDFVEKNYPKQLTPKIKYWQKQKDNFTEYQFNALPLIGTLAQFFQLRIILQEQAQKICNKFYQDAIAEEKYVKEHLHCIFAEEKNKVKPGENYQAKVIVYPSMEVPSMQMEIAGQKVPVINGVGKLKFKPEELGKNYWNGKVSFRLWGRDTIFTSENVYYEVISER